jgi:putative glutamine amidotransferase
VQVQPGGVLARVLARVLGTDAVQVNSVHGQGIHRLADGLRVEALAPDGLVEAFSVAQAAGSGFAGGFALGVQWHPEWQAADNPVSLAMLRAFGAACQDYRDLHRPPSR